MVGIDSNNQIDGLKERLYRKIKDGTCNWSDLTKTIDEVTRIACLAGYYVSEDAAKVAGIGYKITDDSVVVEIKR